MPELTMAAGGVRAFLEFAVSRGASRNALIQRSRINANDLTNRDNRIPLKLYVALVKAGKELCSDPALALHFGEAVDPSEISFTHQIGAPSLAEAFVVMNRYARLTIEVDEGTADRYALLHIGAQLWLVDNRRNANEFPELTESSFARMICMMRRLQPGTPILKAVHVTHEAPAHGAEYERVFGVPVVFGSNKNALLLDDAILTFKPPPTAKYMAEVLTAHADGLLEKLEGSKSVRARVDRLLVTRLEQGDVRMKAIASELGLSRQTLFRRLKSEGVTFERVLDDLRHRLALQHLDGGRKSVTQTAYLLGFSDPAAFSRAFKRWTGWSPRAQTSNRTGK